MTDDVTKVFSSHHAPLCRFLRGVSPMNAKMLELKRAFESAGFTNVKTVISSGNVVFELHGASRHFFCGTRE